MTTKELREKKGSLIHQMEDLKKRADLEKRMMTDDEGRQFDAYDKEMEAVNAEIRRAERLENEAVPTDPESRESHDKKYSEAFMNKIRFNRDSEILSKEFRTSQSGLNTTAATGGYLIPQGFGGEIIKQMYTLSPILNWVTVKNTASGNAIPYPTNDDTANKGHYLAEETQAAQTLTSYGQKTLNAWTLVSDIVPVSFQVLEDSAFDLQQEILNLCTERIARGIDYALILGGGTTDPNGIETAATTQGAYMAKSAITRTTILDLIHSINAGYRMSPKCAFAFADSTLKVIKKLSISSSDDRSLWQPSLIAGQPDTIDGYKYFINDNIDAFGAAGRKPMFFGDWSQYYFRQVGGFHLQIFNERYADFLQRGFMMWTRNDGELMNTSAIKHAICAAT
jgi:HK97 family phage major capsid protein